MKVESLTICRGIHINNVKLTYVDGTEETTGIPAECKSKKSEKVDGQCIKKVNQVIVGFMLNYLSVASNSTFNLTSDTLPHASNEMQAYDFEDNCLVGLIGTRHISPDGSIYISKLEFITAPQGQLKDAPPPKQEPISEPNKTNATTSVIAPAPATANK